MTEPESYLRLGIEAAREENKAEARRFFRLLTSKDPGNVQGWLWLAGVAETREERQDALEHVLALDPDNEMAQKGLQALGVRPAPSTPVVESVAPPVSQPSAASTSTDFDDDPFGELDNLSEVMAADTAGPVRRSDSLPPPIDTTTESETAAVAAAAAADRAEANARSAQRSARSASRRTVAYADDDELEQPRRGLSPLLALLLFLVGLGLIGLLIASLFPGWFSGGQVAEGDPTEAAQTAAAGTGATSVIGGEGTAPAGATADAGATVDPNATADPNATVDPNATAPAGTTDPNATAPAVDPNATAPAGTTDPGTGQATTPPVDVSAANPAILPANSPIQSEGWLYDFPQPTYAASIIGNLGQFTPNNGRFVVVLIHAVNNTGSPQAIPGSFFVLKDAQGRVWEARPEVSDAYVIPGVNADQTQNTAIPADGIYRSVALVFDVAPDATDLVFFARSNPGQGWIVLRSV